MGAAALAGCGGSGTRSDTATADRITVAAASDLRPAFEELGARFEAETGTAVTFSFGSSGQLRQQVLDGAPFDLFASANVAFVDEVIDAGVGVAATKAEYGLGRLALWSPPGVTPPTSVADLADPRFRRIAIANPIHAPYGMAAQQALESTGVLSAIEPRLVYGENIADALRIAKSTNAQVAVIALSLAIAEGTPYVLVPAELHEPLVQALVVTATGPTGDAATEFAALVASTEGREVMVRYGFALPGEPTLDPGTGS